MANARPHTSTQDYRPPGVNNQPPVRPPFADDANKIGAQLQLHNATPNLARDCACMLPKPLDRPRANYPTTADRFERYERLQAAAGTASTRLLIGAFSGRPDQVDLQVTGGAAVVRLTDREDDEGHDLFVFANSTYKTNISKERVWAFNVSDAAPATVTAIGKWAERADRPQLP